MKRFFILFVLTLVSFTGVPNSAFCAESDPIHLQTPLQPSLQPPLQAPIQEPLQTPPLVPFALRKKSNRTSLESQINFVRLIRWLEPTAQANSPEVMAAYGAAVGEWLQGSPQIKDDPQFATHVTAIQTLVLTAHEDPKSYMNLVSHYHHLLVKLEAKSPGSIGSQLIDSTQSYLEELRADADESTLSEHYSTLANSYPDQLKKSNPSQYSTAHQYAQKILQFKSATSKDEADQIMNDAITVYLTHLASLSGKAHRPNLKSKSKSKSKGSSITSRDDQAGGPGGGTKTTSRAQTGTRPSVLNTGIMNASRLNRLVQTLARPVRPKLDCGPEASRPFAGQHMNDGIDSWEPKQDAENFCRLEDGVCVLPEFVPTPVQPQTIQPESIRNSTRKRSVPRSPRRSEDSQTYPTKGRHFNDHDLVHVHI